MAERVVGACPDCGRPMRVTALERVEETDRTRIVGGQQGRAVRYAPHDLVSRIECEHGHVWWLVLDDR